MKEKKIEKKLILSTINGMKLVGVGAWAGLWQRRLIILTLD